MKQRSFVLPLIIVITACCVVACATRTTRSVSTSALDSAAERYVRLGLAFGQHDADYVDAYYGPPEWQAAARQEVMTVEQLRTQADQLDAEISAIQVEDVKRGARRAYLLGQLRAMRTRIDMVSGTTFPFDVESQRLFDAVAPHHDAAYFEALLKQLDAVLPGEGPTNERYTAYRKRFVIPPERLDAVFSAAVAGCRERTLRHISLPATETFTIEYVKNKPWSGYNWYKGDFHSLIQVNTDLPIYIDRALDLACHEGYPGHHVYNLLLEQHLVRERHWVEFTINPLFGPQSLISEGSANYGIDLAFPDEERWQWEREHLFSLAGLDPNEAEKYYRIFALAKQLGYAGNEAARAYLSGAIDAAAAAQWLERYALMSPEHARQRVTFIEKYRSYVINYNLGQDIVKRFVESRAGENAGKRWDVFSNLLSEPHLPSQLQ